MSKTHETYVPLSRGIVEHLKVLKGTPLTVYVYLLAEAKYTGSGKGTLKKKISDIASDIEIDYKTVHLALNKLKDKYITIKPAKNQHSLTEFKILKYKTVYDFAKVEQQPESPVATPEAPPVAKGEQLPKLLPKQKESTVENSNNNTSLQSPKKLRSKEGKEVKKNLKDILCFWNQKSIIIHRESKTIDNAIKAALKKYTLDEIIEAILNYSIILNHPETYWLTHPWTLITFLTQKQKNSIETFLSINNPFERYRVKQEQQHGTRQQSDRSKAGPPGCSRHR